MATSISTDMVIKALDADVAEWTEMTSEGARLYIKEYRCCGLNNFHLSDLGRRAVKVTKMVVSRLGLLNQVQEAFPKLTVLKLKGDRIPEGQLICCNELLELNLTELSELPSEENIGKSCYARKVLIKTCKEGEVQGRNKMIRCLLLNGVRPNRIHATLKEQIGELLKTESDAGCELRCRSKDGNTEIDLIPLSYEPQMLVKIHRLLYKFYLPTFPQVLIDIMAEY